MNTPNSFQSQVVMAQDFALDRFDLEKSFLLYDENLLSKEVVTEELQSFVNAFSFKAGVKAGENLKDFKNFPKQLDGILKALPQPVSRNHHMVVMGGGTLGDFGGFVASILKRGMKLIHIPTTWLAAMDSAHGGKTGLNYGGVKNQLGTFYPAEQIFVIKPLLEMTPDELKAQSFGELIKMSLVGDSLFFKEMMMEKRSAHEFMWRFLPFCIEDKYSVILRDPYETKEIRQILNFGHTFGHALEAHFGWAHGDAVLQGIFFAVNWSAEKGLLAVGQQEQIINAIADRFDRVEASNLNWYKKPSEKAIRKLIEADKKLDADGNLTFVFLKNIGQPHLEKVSIDEMLEELKRQNWIK